MRLLIVLITILGATIFARAESTVVDQSFENYGGYASVPADWRQAQTFTVGLTGSLVRIEAALRPGEIFDLSDTADVTLLLIRPHGETPSFPPGVLATVPVHIPNPGFERVNDGAPPFVLPFQWVQFQLPDIFIESGEVLAFALQSGDHEYQWAADFQSDYSRGDGFWGPPNAFQHPTGDDQRDYLFRTYVAALPEPATGMSMVAVFLILSCVGRRRF
jgi:hypothetical protein